MHASHPIDQLVQRARDALAHATSIVCFSGAGLSAESGVPTFRDAHALGGALWAKYNPETLASPHGFARDPAVVVEWYNWRRKAIAAAEPNEAHRALAKSTRVMNVTQNVDDLLERAGARGVIHLHGTIAIDFCENRCGREEAVHMSDPPPLRNCPRCGSSARMRPGVVWFGESLPTDAWNAAERACRACQALLVVGTSAVVYPAAGLIRLAKSHGSRIIIVNTQRSDASGLADLELLGPAGEIVPRILP